MRVRAVGPLTSRGVLDGLHVHLAQDLRAHDVGASACEAPLPGHAAARVQADADERLHTERAVGMPRLHRVVQPNARLDLPRESSSQVCPMRAAPPPTPSTTAVSQEKNFHRSRGISRTTAPSEGGSAVPSDGGGATTVCADAGPHTEATRASDTTIRQLRLT